MAIIQSGSAAGTVLLVDPAHGAARVSMRPNDVLTGANGKHRPSLDMQAEWSGAGIATVAMEFAEASAF